jgi:hypothetical protein
MDYAIVRTLLLITLAGLLASPPSQQLAGSLISPPSSDFGAENAMVDWTHYHNYTEIVEILLRLNATFPTLVDVFSIGRSWENRTIYCARLTNENRSQAKPETLYVGFHHARERITAELPLYFVVYAVGNYAANATVRRLLDLSEIYVIVALNVDGIAAVEVNEWHRKTVRPFDEDGDGAFDEDPPEDVDGDGQIGELVRWNGTEWWSIRLEGIDNDADGVANEDWAGGVDINRNYGYEWSAACWSGSTNQSAEDYRGPIEFSEAETRAIRDLVENHRFRYAVSFHSGAECILYPWGHTTTPSSDETTFKSIADDLSALVNTSSLQSAELYTTSGVWEDWMYGDQGVLAFTCEIYENSSAFQYEPSSTANYSWRKGITAAFNPPVAQIVSTVRRWMPVFFCLSDKAIPADLAFLGINWKIWVIAAAVIGGSAAAGVILSRRRKARTQAQSTSVLNRIAMQLGFRRGATRD